MVFLPLHRLPDYLFQRASKVILTASGYSGGGAFISCQAPAVVAGLFFLRPVSVALSAAFYRIFFLGYILPFPFLFLPVCAPCDVRGRSRATCDACVTSVAGLCAMFPALRYAHSRPTLQPVPGLWWASPGGAAGQPGHGPRRGHASGRPGFGAQNAADLHFGDRR